MTKDDEIKFYKSNFFNELARRQALEEKIKEIWFFMKSIAEPDED
jgi:hypothetical protein